MAQKDTTTEINQMVDIVREIENVVSNYSAEEGNHRRQEMEFYHEVVAGNVQVVREVSDYLEKNNMKNELLWAFGAKEGQLGVHPKVEKTKPRRLTHGIILGLMMLLSLLLTPIVYMLHAGIHKLYWIYRSSTISNVKLPLVLAILSGNQDMVRLFLRKGCAMNSTDEQSNTLFHYLADLSSARPMRVTQCVRSFLEMQLDLFSVKDVLMKRNYQNLSGLEALAKYGSIQCFDEVFRKCFSSRVRASDALSSYMNPDLEDDTECGEQFSQGSSTPRSLRLQRLYRQQLTVAELDMTIYEKEDSYGLNSYLYQIFCSYAIERLSEADVLTIKTSSLVNTGLKRLTKKYLAFCTLWNIMGLIVAALILYQVIFCHFEGIHSPDMNKKFLEAFDEQLSVKLDNKTNVSCSVLGVARQKAVNELVKNCKDSFVEKDHAMIEQHVNTSISLTMILENPQEYTIMLIITVFLINYLGIDLLTRTLFLWYNYNSRASSVREGVLPVLLRWLPGSYVDKQLCVFGSFMYLVFPILRHQQRNVMMEAQANLEKLCDGEYMVQGSYKIYKEQVILPMTHVWDVGDRANTVLLVCVFITLLRTCHFFRLIPLTRFFVVASKIMFKDIAYFVTLFIVVSVSIAANFYVTMFNPDCPIYKNLYFKSFERSLFSVYQLGIGRDAANFTDSVYTMLLYFLCTIVMSIMLMNLIVAVMTTKVIDLNVQPWREMMCRMEFWNELLGIEAQTLALTYPVRTLKRKICKKYSFVSTVQHVS